MVFDTTELCFKGWMGAERVFIDTKVKLIQSVVNQYAGKNIQYRATFYQNDIFCSIHR